MAAATAVGPRGALRCLLGLALAAVGVEGLGGLGATVSDVTTAVTVTDSAAMLNEVTEFVESLNLSSVQHAASIEELLLLPPPLNATAELDSDEDLKGTAKLARHYGYPAEAHTVRTEDGYLLAVFRLPRPGAAAVLLMHGLASSSAAFVLTGPGRALALLLYDAGYDVWLGNARGNSESRRHKSLRPSQAAFWDFSWHEMGMLDLPACIDYVLYSTGQASLHYIGHSQGTTTFFVLGSEKPEYMGKVKTFIALAPVAFPRDIRSVPFRFVAIGVNRLALVLRLVGVHELVRSSPLYPWLGRLFCGSDKVTEPICSNVYFLLFGYSQQLIEDLLPVILLNMPAGAGTKQIRHYGQLVEQKDLVFRQFDYGVAGNLQRYQSATPPDYDLSNVTAPTYLFHADDDIVAVQTDLNELLRRLPNVAASRRVPFSAFNHADFLLGANASTLVYSDILDIIGAHEAAGD